MKGSFRFTLLSLLILSSLNGTRLHGQATAFMTVRENSVCSGDSLIVDILISGGKAPYTLIISDQSEDIDTLRKVNSPVLYWLKPTHDMDVRVSHVEDANGIEGSAPRTESIEVLPVSEVSFLLDRNEFLKSEGGILLASSPTGATFMGNGIQGNTFYPGVAGVNTHELSCMLTNANGCTSYDYTEVNVIHGEAQVLVRDNGTDIENICDAGGAYEIEGSNLDGLTGLFRLRRENESIYLEGYIVDEDSSDNKALLEPEGLWGNLVVEYHCESDELQFMDEYSIRVNDLAPLTMEGFPELICSGDDPYLLSPGGVPVDDDAVYVFSGPGITGNQEEGYFFDPGDPAVSSSSQIVKLNYTTGGGCSAELDRIVKVNYSPELSFTFSPSCLPLEGGTVQFSNTSTGQFSVDRWEWDFGDPGSGEQNQSSERNPEHYYGTPGNYRVELNAYTAQGCVSSFVSDTILPDDPVADFTWMHDCYTKGESTSFFSRSSSSFSVIDSLQWTFSTSSGLVLGVLTSNDPEEHIEFPFSSMDRYGVALEVWDRAGCHDGSEDEIVLHPILQMDAYGYLEEFNEGDGQWTSFGSPDSWSLDIPDFKDYEGPSTGDAWFTDFPVSGFEGLEHSGVESPCLDLGNAVRPMVSMEIMRSFRPGNDGAVLQYNRGMGQGWETLGSLGSGGNWYNLNGLESAPGGSTVGWGLHSYVPDKEWQLVSHDLSMVSGQKHLRFRVAQASGFDTDLQNQGFAFDNFRVSEDLRTSLMEHFTNSAQEESRLADDVLDGFVWQNRLQLIDLQYHMDYPGVDSMNLNNPSMPDNRAFQLGVSDIPFAILNGSGDPDYRYDFTSPDEEPNRELLIQESLQSAPFLLELDVDWGEEGLSATVVTTCDVDSYGPNVQLYVAVKERMIRAYTGLNGDTEFRNVALDMLPSTSGTRLRNSWSRGDSDTRTFDWEYADYVEDVGDLVVVAFVAKLENGNVMQAIARSKTSISSVPGRTPLKALAVYPNPAGDFVYVNTGDHQNAGSLRVSDLNGRVLVDMPVQEGYSISRIDVSTLAGGIYVLSYSKDGRLEARAKLLKR